MRQSRCFGRIKERLEESRDRRKNSLSSGSIVGRNERARFYKPLTFGTEKYNFRGVVQQQQRSKLNSPCSVQRRLARSLASTSSVFSSLTCSLTYSAFSLLSVAPAAVWGFRLPRFFPSYSSTLSFKCSASFLQLEIDKYDYVREFEGIFLFLSRLLFYFMVIETSELEAYYRCRCLEL